MEKANIVEEKKSRKAAGEEEQEKAGKGREGKHRGDACMVTALPKMTWWGNSHNNDSKHTGPSSNHLAYILLRLSQRYPQGVKSIILPISQMRKLSQRLGELPR